MTEAKRPKRRKLFVDPEIQTKMIKAAAVPMAGAVLVGFIMLIQFGHLLQKEAALLGTKLPMLAYMFVGTLAFFAFALVVQALIAVRLSHQVAGAAFRIRRTLETFRKEDPAIRARLRKDDLLQTLAAEVNEFLDWAESATAESGSPPAKPATERNPSRDAIPVEAPRA